MNRYNFSSNKPKPELSQKDQKMLVVKAKGVDLKKKMRAHGVRNREDYENFIALIEKAEDGEVSSIIGPHNLTGNVRLDASMRAYIKKLGVEFIHQPQEVEDVEQDQWDLEEDEN